MPLFDFQTAFQISAGPGSLSRLPQLSKGLGVRALVVTGRSRARADAACKLLSDSGVATASFAIAGEPTLETVREGVRLGREWKADFAVGFGGGSAIDAAKAIAVLLANSGEPLDYLEVIGRGSALEKPPIPVIAIPTTAGTGAEVTRNAVLSSPEHQSKASLRGPFLLPRVALVDPELTIGLPPEITANTGLDALTQLLEAFVSCRANAFSDMLCREGLARAGKSLHRAYQWASRPPSDDELTVREDMSFASLLSGMALANAGLGVVHGFAAPLGGMLEAAHGAICASLLPAAVRTNTRALRDRQPGSRSLAAYVEAAAILTGDASTAALEWWLTSLCSELHIKTISELGLAQGQIPVAVERAAKASSMRGNPIDLTDEELTQILIESC